MKQKRMISEYSSIIKSQDYMNELKAMAARIRKVSFSTPNEATIEGRFDNELFAFFRNCLLYTSPSPRDCS